MLARPASEDDGEGTTALVEHVSNLLSELASREFELNDLSGQYGDEYVDPYIDKDTANEIIVRLRALPQDQVDIFLEQCRVECVSALRQSDIEAAYLLLGALEIRLGRRRRADQVERAPFEY